jgi:hypothetical protein
MSADASVARAAGTLSERESQPKRWMGGTLSGLACKCLEDGFTDFLIKDECIVCACCGRVIKCVPPIKGIYSATCGCCISTEIKTTFVLDSKGVYTCTWCGRSR